MRATARRSRCTATRARTRRTCLLPAPPCRLLDAGCGTGWTSLFFARHRWEVVGCDIAPDMIAQAEEMWRPLAADAPGEVVFEAADATALEPGEPFDAVLIGGLSVNTFDASGRRALLEAARQAECDVIVVEALDRLSRDQEDVAGFFKRCRFAGVQIVTLAEGEGTGFEQRQRSSRVGTARGGEHDSEAAVGVTDEMGTIAHQLGDVVAVTQEVVAVGGETFETRGG